MAKLFCEQAHFKHAQSAGGIVGPQSLHRETRLGRPRRVEASFKNVSSSTHMRGAAAPVSSGMRLSQKRGMVAGATTKPHFARLARFSDCFPEGSRLYKGGCKRACLRTLALIQLYVIGESCAPQFRNACQEYELQTSL
jgi:hypothetical protein